MVTMTTQSCDNDDYYVKIEMPFTQAAERVGLTFTPERISATYPMLKASFARRLGIFRNYAVFKPSDDGSTVAYVPRGLSETFAKKRIAEILHVTQG
jgi:hypothetical protein